jgi:hypothetical protein
MIASRMLLVFAAYFFPASCIAQAVQFRFELKPPPSNLAELKALPGPTPPDHPCAIARVDPDSSKPTPITLADTTLLFLPRGWKLLPLYERDRELGVTRVATPDGSRIDIRLERNASGRRFISYGPDKPLPRGESCILESGQFGAIWTFYEPDPAAPDRPLPFPALAEIITPGPKWYHVSISSKTAQQREFVTRRITDLLLHRSVGPIGIAL